MTQRSLDVPLDHALGAAYLGLTRHDIAGLLAVLSRYQAPDPQTAALVAKLRTLFSETFNRVP